MIVVSRVSPGRRLGTVAGAVGSAIGLISLSLFAAALITLPAWPKTGVGLFGAELTGSGLSTPAVSVNRALKGDRLPVNIPRAAPPPLSVPLPHARMPEESQPAPARSRTRAQIPLGCDAAFSPISTPLLAHVFRRCLV